MKRILLSISLLVCTAVHALYNGNPAEPELIDEGFFLSKENWASIKTGYEGDFVFDRKLRAYDGASGRIDEFQYLMNQGVLTFNFQDSYELYGSAGSMKSYVTLRPHVDFKQREFDTNDHFTWGVGGKAIVFHWGSSQIGMDAKYQEAIGHVKWNAIDGATYTTNAQLQYREWQVSAGVSHHIDIFTPYLTVNYSSVHAKMHKIRHNILNNPSFKMRSREHWGLAVGCSLSTAKLLDLNFEVQMINEEALTLAGNVKF